MFFSLVVARMLTPTMAAHLLKASEPHRRTPRWILLYLRAARLCLRHRRITAAATVLLVAAGLGIASLLPGEFIPADDGNQTQVTLTLPPGSLLQDTRALAERARVLVAGRRQSAGGLGVHGPRRGQWRR